MAFTAWLSLVVCSAASRVFDETEPVDLLQRTLQLDGGSEGAAAQAERLRKVLPMAWIHVPKCGTSFANTLVGMPHFCPDAPENYDVESSAPDGCLFRVFAPNVCKSFCDQNYLHCWNGKDGNNYHAFVGNESQYLKVKGHMVGLFRQPEQRLLSAYYDGHDWINGGNGTRCDKSHTGELSVPDFAPLFAGSMTYQLTYLQPVHWGAKYGPTITRSLALEAAKRVKEGFAYVGLTEEWDLSICLFHAMFGGACHSSEFRNVRPGEHEKESDGEYDTSVLEGFQDEMDGLVYAEAVRIFHKNLALYNVSAQSCRAGCWQEAIKGLHDA